MSIDVRSTTGDSLSARVAEEIRVLLARRRIRQSHLARQMGVSEQWISVRLRGVQPIDLNDLERIAAVLGVRAGDLLPNDTGGVTGRLRPVGHGPTDNRPVGHPTAVRRPARTARPAGA